MYVPYFSTSDTTDFTIQFDLRVVNYNDDDALKISYGTQKSDGNFVAWDVAEGREVKDELWYTKSVTVSRAEYNLPDGLQRLITYDNIAIRLKAEKWQHDTQVQIRNLNITYPGNLQSQIRPVPGYHTWEINKSEGVSIESGTIAPYGKTVMLENPTTATTDIELSIVFDVVKDNRYAPVELLLNGECKIEWKDEFGNTQEVDSVRNEIGLVGTSEWAGNFPMPQRSATVKVAPGFTARVHGVRTLMYLTGPNPGV